MLDENSYKKIENKYSAQKQTELWNMAIGLQQVDNLHPSEYLQELATEHVAGKLSNTEIEELLYRYYEHETPEERVARTKECDLVSNRIVNLLQNDGAAFSLTPATLLGIHGYLFKGIYRHAGKFRNYNISKKEPILNGQSVKYTNHFMIGETLKYDMEEERNWDYDFQNPQKVIHRISSFTSRLWQVHPFGEGNTRTTAIFMERYLHNLGFEVDKEIFQGHAKYFRNALVRSNYADFSKHINSNPVFLERFFDNLLLKGNYPLHSRDLILEDLFPKRKQ